MDTKFKIIISGTSHELQCGTDEYSPESIYEFKAFIKEICHQNKVRCVVEEMSGEGLSDRGVNNTVAFEIAKDLSIEHYYTDLTSKHLIDLYMHIDSYMLREPTNELKISKRDLLHKNLLDPVRERYWLANIIFLNIWPTLFICGSEHVENMKALITSLKYGPVCSFVKY